MKDRTKCQSGESHNFQYVDRKTVKYEGVYPYVKYRYDCSKCGERRLREVTLDIGWLEI